METRLLTRTRRLCREREQGFLIRELPRVTELLATLEEKALSFEGDDPTDAESEGLLAVDFVAALCNVLSTLEKPLVRERANEELLPEGRDAMETIVRRLTDLLTYPVEAVSDAALKTLYAIARPKPRPTGDMDPAKAMDLRPAPKAYAQGVLLRAGAVEATVVQFRRLVFASELRSNAAAASAEGAESGEAAAEGVSGAEAQKEAAPAAEDTTLQLTSLETEQGGADSSLLYAAASAPAPQAAASLFDAPEDELESSVEDSEMPWEEPAAPEDGGAPVLDDLDRRESYDDLASFDTENDEVMLAASEVTMTAAGAHDSTTKGDQGTALAAASPYPASHLRMLCELSRRSECAVAIAEAGCVDPLVQGLEPLLIQRDPMIEVAVELLWNLCNASPVAIEDLATVEHVALLRALTEDLFREGYRAQDKNLRNQMLIILSLLAKSPEAQDCFRHTGLLHLLLVYGTAGEVGVDEGMMARLADDAAHHSSAPILGSLRNFCTVDALDVEMRRLLWGLIGALSLDSQENLDVVAGSAFIDALLVYLETVEVDGGHDAPGTGRFSSSSSEGYNDFTKFGSPGTDGGPESFADLTPGASGMDQMDYPETASQARVLPAVVQRLHVTDMRQLQQCAMSVLLTLGPRAPESFLSGGGHVVTLRFIDKLSQCLGSTKRNTPDAVELENLLRLALMVLIAVVASGALQAELGEMGGVAIMLQRFADGGSAPELRSDAVTILGWLCNDHSRNQDTLRKLGGIPTMIHVLQDFVDKRGHAGGANATMTQSASTTSLQSQDNASQSTSTTLLPTAAPILPPALLIRTLDSLWSCIVGNRRSESRFLESEGMDMLLELLEVCAPLQRAQVLSFLADLLENPRAVEFFKSWRSDRSNGISGVTLILRIWEQEEGRLGCSRKLGVLQNIEAPLRPPEVEDLPAFQENAGPEAEDFTDDEGEEGLGAGTMANPIMSPKDEMEPKASPQAFSRLSEALEAGAKADPEKNVMCMVEGVDIRGKAFAVLDCVGFEQCLSLLKKDSPEEQTLIMVKYYHDFITREAWVRVRDELEEKGCKPIASDRREMELALKAGFDIAETAKEGQAGFAGAAEKLAFETEQAFFQGILHARDQEVHQLKLKKASMLPKGLMRRKAEKEAMQQMLASSSVDSLTSATEGEDDTATKQESQEQYTEAETFVE